MNYRLIRIALILSLGANCSFVAGALYVKHRVDSLATLDGRLEILFRRLDASAGQRALARAAADTYLERERPVRDGYRERSAEFLREMSQPVPDRALLEKGLIAFEEFERAMAPARRVFFLDLFRVLTPAQRKKLFDLRRRSNIYLFAGLPG